MERNEIQIISSTDALGAVVSAEIDKQIATAHAYPRNFALATNKIMELATMDEKVAQECYYSLKRTDKNGTTTFIEGPSIRLAEIVASQWGNIRIASRVIGDDGKMVTVEAVCHDLETNVAISVQQVRSIRTKDGHPFSNDMKVLTTNAASAIAMRNAINKVVPLAITNKIVCQCKDIVVGMAKDNLYITRQRLVSAFGAMNVSADMLCKKCGVGCIDEIDAETIVTLRGLFTALNDGATTIEDEFPLEVQAPETEAKKKAKEVMGKIMEGKK